ncbi:VOC family protein [Virgibacillus kekensis]|uniref:VOC family protein n=1 Tax=Virgibacillus kekensis TaxID=202261 RepID=A0ABV9DNU5_9BACI
MAFHANPAMYADHIHLKVSNLTRSLGFYHDVLGFRILEEYAGFAQLTAGGLQTCITIEQVNDALPLNPANTGLFHVAFLVPSRRELAKVLRHLIHLEYPLYGASDHLVSEAIYLTDPDGNGIEIYADRDPGEWEWARGQVKIESLPLNTDDLMSEIGENGWEGIPEKTIIGHIHLQVSDLEETGFFYTEGFGFDIVTRYGRKALFLSSENYHHHIGLNIWNSAGGASPSEKNIGLKHFSISIPETEREIVAGRLKSSGWPVKEEAEKYAVTDPSGNKVIF